MVDGRNFFDKPIRNDLETCNNIKKIPTGEGDDYTSECLPDYLYFKKKQQKNYKLIAIDLSKQQQLAVHPKGIQLIIFTENLTKVDGATMFSILTKQKKHF